MLEDVLPSHMVEVKKKSFWITKFLIAAESSYLTGQIPLDSSNNDDDYDACLIGVMNKIGSLRIQAKRLREKNIYNENEKSL